MSTGHTALRCLVAVGRHHGLDLNVERLAHEHSLGEAEPDAARLQRIATEAGLEAKPLALDWDSLRAQPQGSYPLLLRLKNGNTVVALGFRGEEAVVSDPLADRPGHLMLARASLEAAWGGEALALRRLYKLSDENQPFGLRWFVPEILRQKSLFRDVAIAAILLHLIGLSLPIFFQLVIDRVLVHQTYSTLYVLCIGIVIALAFEAVFGFLRQYLVLYATTKIDLRLAVRVFAHMMSLPVAFFEQHVSGVLLQHMQQQRRIREFLTGRLFVTMLDATVLLVFLPVLLLYSVKLTLIMLAFCAAIALVMLALIGPFRERLLKLYQAEAERQGLLVESIHGMSTVKSLALEPRQRRAWEERVAAAAELQFRVGKISAIAQTGTQLLEKLMLVAIIAFGAADVFSGAMTVGALVAFQMLSGRVSGPLVQMVSLIHEFQETSLAVRMLGEVMNRAPEPGALSRGLRPVLRGQIEFDGVTFAYGGGAERALDRVSFRVPEGGVVGVVGRSGSGKTTVARLIQGLHQAQEGAVRIDGYNVRELDVAHLRRSVGIVPQETFLFKGSVRDNIGIARPDAPLEEIVEAARLAGADDFIDRLPQGIHTPLDEGGSNLSGGQRQRLAIARALLLRPRVLIFDEATSSLDPESEAIVQKNLAGIAAGRTLVMITHRLSNLVGADAILVMDRGRVVDHGPHAELAGRPGVYASLWRQQTRHMA
jgi:ATP-binding cassette, subfamily B, bacterial HlyB/CyaB